MAITILPPSDPRFPKSFGPEIPDRIRASQIASVNRKDPTDTFIKETVSVVGQKSSIELVHHVPVHPHPETGENRPFHRFVRPIDNRQLFTSMTPAAWDRLADDSLIQWAGEHGVNVAHGPTGEWQSQRTRMVALDWPPVVKDANHV
jgi:hypothetical protein